jgi:hypothetical protein
MPMNLESLYELKKQYEVELIRAEAKVAVITDIIATQESPPEAEPTEETFENSEDSTLQNY